MKIRSHVAFLRSARTRAALSLGVVLAVASTGTFAYWTDSANLTGTTFTSGTFDVQLNENGGAFGDNAAQATLSLANMAPGATSADTFSLKNNGNVQMKWSLTGGLNGTDAAAVGTAGVMKLLVTDGTKSGTTCTAGTTTYVNNVVLTATTSTSLLAGQGPLAAAGTKPLCFQFTFAATADNTLQTKTFGATFTFSGTSDLS
jgi:predicted ribosomally synthesized peptide with SipW-like signal peptide